MSLEDDLQEINGVGEATAEKIMTVFEEHNSEDVPDVVSENLQQAMDYYNDNQYEYAGKFLRRAVDGL